MRVLIAITALALLPATAAARYRIETDDYVVTRIGGFHPAHNDRVGAAIKAFGEPDVRRLTQYNSCKVRWDDIGLMIEFANYGGSPEGETTCSDHWGYAQSFVARGRRFASWRGVHPGTRSSAVPHRHPDATRHAHGWWLRSAVSNAGDTHSYAVLRASVRHARVSALVGWVGGAGE